MRSIDIKMISYSHVNKTYFHKRGFALRPRPNVKLFMRGAKLSEKVREKRVDVWLSYKKFF